MAIPILLLPLGCRLRGDMAPRFQTAPLAGDPAGLGKFAGRWFDENGNLIAVVSNSPEPRLSVQTPYDLEPKDAHLKNGKIVFRLTNDKPEEISLQLTGEDELSVEVAEEPNATCGYHVVQAIVLLRNPPPAWLMKQSLRKGTAEAAQFASKAYEGALDRLARIL